MKKLILFTLILPIILVSGCTGSKQEIVINEETTTAVIQENIISNRNITLSDNSYMLTASLSNGWELTKSDDINAIGVYIKDQDVGKVFVSAGNIASVNDATNVIPKNSEILSITYNPDAKTIDSIYKNKNSQVYLRLQEINGYIVRTEYITPIPVINTIESDRNFIKNVELSPVST